jgi:quercetin dioxygenase-like cupin family protein
MVKRKKARQMRAIAIILVMAFMTTAARGQGSEIFPKGTRTANDNFSGVVWVHMIVPADTTYDAQIANVNFEPGVRTKWHYHPSGQILMITSGTAYYQEKGKPKQILTKGDVATCPPNVPHWHGAAPGTTMSHVAVSPNMKMGTVVWQQKVTDEEYAAPAKQEHQAAQSSDPALIFPKGEAIDVNHFSAGRAWVHWLLRPESVYNTQLASVTYEQGSRTKWHYHPAGQILIITSGTAYYQERGKPKQILSKGDVAKCPPGVNHWHGAAPESSITLMAINPNMQKGAVTWLEPVTVEQYSNR